MNFRAIMQSAVSSQQSAVSSQQSAVSSQQRRNVYLDTVKGLAIFLTVFGHCIQFFSTKGFDFFGDIVFRVIYSFHMPLFALVSGYLFYGSASGKTLREILAKQAGEFLLPVLSWTLIQRVIGICLKLMRGNVLDCEYLTLGLIRSFMGNLWFLWAMFWSSLAVVIAEKFFQGKIKFYILLIVLSVFVPGKIISSLHVFMYPYFAAGYLWHRFGFDRKIESVSPSFKISAGAAIIFAWLAMLPLYGYSSYIYTTGTAVVKYREGLFMPSQLYTDIFRWVIGFAGSCSAMILLKLIKPVKFLALAGTKTLGIYIISGYIFSHVRLEYGGYIINFIEAVIITALCYALSVIISRSRILNKLLLGGR